MVKEGVLQNPRPQAIFGLHTFSEMAVGDIGYSEGPALSAADTWEVKITGRQSHGARPELSIDPIVTAARVRPGAADDPIAQLLRRSSPAS